MDVFLHSALLIALAEIGDKTQLLAIMLAARYPGAALKLILGVLAATLLNHYLAALAGVYLRDIVGSDWLRWVIGASFIGIGLWVLIPDKYEEDKKRVERGAFLTTFVTFFLAEMGDKTQLATIALGAEFPQVGQVVAGTTLGMLIANVPAIYFGAALLQKIPVRWVHIAASLLFIGMGILVLLK